MGWAEGAMWAEVAARLLQLHRTIEGREYEVPNEVMLSVVGSLGFLTAVVDAPAICYTGMCVVKSPKLAAMQLQRFILGFLGDAPQDRSVVIVFDNERKDPDKLATERRLEAMAARANDRDDAEWAARWAAIIADLYSTEQVERRRQMQENIVHMLQELLEHITFFSGKASSRVRFVTAEVLCSPNPFVYRRDTHGLHRGCADPEPRSSCRTSSSPRSPPVWPAPVQTGSRDPRPRYLFGQSPPRACRRGDARLRPAGDARAQLLHPSCTLA